MGTYLHSGDHSGSGLPRLFPRRATTTLLLATTVAAIASFLIHEVISLDVWWQVAIGRDILATLEVPNIDLYSALGVGRPYHDSHWLFQVVLAAADAALGMVGVQLVMIAIWSAVLWITYRSCRRWVAPGPAAILVVLTAMASVERFLPRPEIVTVLAIAIFWNRLQDKRWRSWADLLVLALVQAVWANSHGLFVIGIFMVGCYLLWELLRSRDVSASEVTSLARATALVFLASLLTPFPLAGWHYAFLLFGEAGAQAPTVLQGLGELSPTFGQAARSSPAFWFFLPLLAASVVGVAAQVLRRRGSARILILGGLAAAAFTGRRNIILFAVVAAPFVAESLAGLPHRWVRLPKLAEVLFSVTLLWWCWYPLSGAFYLDMELPARFGLGVTPSFFPHDLPSFLDSIAFEGQILNSNTLGGFWTYHRYPPERPLTDGRWEVYEADRLNQVLDATRSGVGWERILEDFDVGGVLLAHSSSEAKGILTQLAETRNWRLAYLDRAASFWIRASAARDIRAISLIGATSLPPTPRPDDAIILNEFFAQVDAPELQLANLTRLAATGFEKDRLLELTGSLQVRLGQAADAQLTYQRLIERNPANAAAHNELAYLYYSEGDLSAANRHIGLAVELAPDNAKYRENLERVEEAARKARGEMGQ